MWLARTESDHERAARQVAEFAPRSPHRITAAPPRSRMAQARVHTGSAAAAASRALGARAFTLGEHIVFGAGHYAPHTPQGERLLLHELAHVEQQTSHSFGLLVLRDEAVSTAPTETSTVTMSATLDNLSFNFGNRRYHAGATRPQIWPMLLRRLLGAQYNESRNDEIFASWQTRMAAADQQFINDLDQATSAQVNHDIGDRRLTSVAALLLIQTLETDFDFRVDIRPEQRELLELGYALNSAWPALKARFHIPAWYTEFMFRRQMAEHAPQLRDWRSMAPTTPGVTADDNDRATMLDSIHAALIGPINLLESIRLDYTLGNAALDNRGTSLEERHRADGGHGYRGLWDIRAAHTERLNTAPPEDKAGSGYALGMLGYVSTQPDVAAAAAQANAAGHANRLELLGRFQRYMERAGHRLASGDERLFNVPARATDPPWNANLTSTPELTPPLYDAALETDHAFTMQLEFGDVFDAFAVYAYRWKFVRIPDPAPGQAVPDPLTAEGLHPSFGSVWDTRLARAHRYNATDLERVRSRFGSTRWGRAISSISFGTSLARLNNALRTLGTVIHTVLDRLTQPRNTTRFVFPSSGMYVAVCEAVPILDGDEEVSHAPSVAMLPVVAREPDEMAISRVRDTSRNEFQMRLRVSEIREMLASPIPPENASDLQSEMRELQSMLAEPAQALSSRHALLEEQIAVLQRRLDLRRQIREAEAAVPPDTQRIAGLRRQLFEAGGADSSTYSEERNVHDLEHQRDSVNDMISMREARVRHESGALFVPHATFVSDLGQSLALTLEMYDRSDVNGEYQVFISDLTTPDSGQVTGTAVSARESNPRVAAVLDGVKRLLESHSDYGRGRVAIEIEGVVHTVRIDAGTGRMLMEGIENGVTVLSLAAIVAAPFTAGESLVLLLPLGAIGAIPAAYRLYQRYDEHHLRFDLAAVMDVVNIVAGVIGLAHAATPLRMVRLGRVMMIAGLGADGAGMLMMSVGLVTQIQALADLPEHERATQLLLILGGAMVQLGIQVGAAVMHAQYQGARESAASRRSQPGGLPEEAPGFRLPPEGSGPTSQVDPSATPARAPADRSAAGAVPPGTSAPRTGPAPRRPASAHERLLARFREGIDYNRPPPAADVAHPPRSGEYGRRFTDPDAAYHAYNDAVASSNGREVGLFHDPHTGEYQVMIGSETGVAAPGHAGWDAVVHYHPDGSTRLTLRLPSPHDFQGLMFRYLEGGMAVHEFVEFDIPGVGRGRTEYGIDPTNPEPFYVRIHRPNEQPQTLRFAHDGAFHAYWGERTVYVEPGSPLYESMVRDMQDYVRSLGRDETVPRPAAQPEGAAGARPAGAEPEGPSGARPAGGESEGTPAATPSTSGRSAASTGGGNSGRLSDGAGGLTDAGVAFIRRRFRSVREFGARGRNARRIELEHMTDAQIRQRFPTEPSWLEATVIGEVRQSWIGRTNTTDFLLDNPTQSLRQVAARLAEAVSAGNTGHVMNEAVLDLNVLDFIRDRVAANDPTLRPAWDALEASTNPSVRAEWNDFLFGRRNIPARERQALMASHGGVGEGFGSGRVGTKRPDVVEVMLSGDAIHVLDPSQQWASPIHNFKTAFYEAVIRQLIDVAHVTSADTGGGARIRPTGQ